MNTRRTFDWRPAFSNATNTPGIWILIKDTCRKADLAYARKKGFEAKRTDEGLWIRTPVM